MNDNADASLEEAVQQCAENLAKSMVKQIKEAMVEMECAMDKVGKIVDAYIEKGDTK
jgi:flagellar hook-basal body complex protein FliE